MPPLEEKHYLARKGAVRTMKKDIERIQKGLLEDEFEVELAEQALEQEKAQQEAFEQERVAKSEKEGEARERMKQERTEAEKSARATREDEERRRLERERIRIIEEARKKEEQAKISKEAEPQKTQEQEVIQELEASRLAAENLEKQKIEEEQKKAAEQTRIAELKIAEENLQREQAEDEARKRAAAQAEAEIKRAEEERQRETEQRRLEEEKKRREDEQRKTIERERQQRLEEERKRKVIEEQNKQAEAERIKREEEEKRKEAQIVAEARKQTQAIAEKEKSEDPLYQKKIFLQDLRRLETESAKLEKSARDLEKAKKPVDLRKAALLREISEIEKVFQSIADREEKIEEEEDVLEGKEELASTPKEKKQIEKERWILESRRQELEKRRWPWDEKINQLHTAIQRADSEYQELYDKQYELKKLNEDLSEKKEKLNSKIEKIDISLRQGKINEMKTALSTERTGLLRRLPETENDLALLAIKEKEIEDKKKNIDASERMTSDLRERSKLEQERWEVEAERRRIESNRWRMEKEKQQIENQLARVEEKFQNLLDTEENIQRRLIEMDQKFGFPFSKTEGAAAAVAAADVVVRKTEAKQGEKISVQPLGQTEIRNIKLQKEKTTKMGPVGIRIQPTSVPAPKIEIKGEKVIPETGRGPEMQAGLKNGAAEEKKSPNQGVNINISIETGDNKNSIPGKPVSAGPSETFPKAKIFTSPAEQEERKEQVGGQAPSIIGAEELMRFEEAKKRIEALKRAVSERGESTDGRERTMIDRKEKSLETLRRAPEKKQPPFVGEKEGAINENKEKEQSVNQRPFSSQTPQISERFKRVEKEIKAPYFKPVSSAPLAQSKKPFSPASSVSAKTPTEIIRPLPQKPSLREKLWVRFLAASFLLVLLAGIGTFWYWYLVIRPQPPVGPVGCQTNTDCPAGYFCSPSGVCNEISSKTCRNDDECPINAFCGAQGNCIARAPGAVPVDAFFPIEGTRTLSITTSDEIKPLLLQVMQESQNIGQMRYVPIINTQENKVLSLKDIIDALQIRVPDGFYNKVKEAEFNLFSYSQPEGNRLGFVAKVEVKEGLAEMLKAQEPTMKDDLKPFWTLAIPDQVPVSRIFNDAKQYIYTYLGYPFRIQVIARNDVALAYAVSDNYLVLTMSWSSMEEAINRLGIKPSPMFITKDLSFGIGQRTPDPEVIILQTWLSQDKDLLYPKNLITGYFGYNTRAAVIKFQEKYRADILAPQGLTKGNGIVDLRTRTKLNELYSGAPIP